MKKHFLAFAFVALAASATSGTLAAQQPAAPAPPAAPSANPVLIPLRVQVVVSRWQGEKRVSSLPYVLSVNAVEAPMREAPVSQVRMGAKVPVPAATAPTVDGKPFTGPGLLTASTPVNYQDIGTSIDCRARSSDGGRFEVSLYIDDTSVYTNDQTQSGSPIVPEMPVFRSFRSSSTLILRDGQTSQFTAATDRVSGEITHVDVTLTVVK